jgi:hypothetical protein
MINLVTFGDSWPKGVELSLREKPYGKILSEKLNAKFHNYSVIASSIEHMIVQCDKFIKNSMNKDEKNIGIFFLTSPHRFLTYDTQGNEEHIYPMENNVGSKAYHYYHASSPKLDDLKANISILALQKMCIDYNIDDYYINGWIKPNFFISGIDVNKFYDQGNITAADLFNGTNENEFLLSSEINRNNLYVYPNVNHPNQLGHQLIADKLETWIRSKL